MPLDDVRRVFLSDNSIYPLDNVEVKRRFLDTAVKLDLLTLSDDPQGNLEGFLICFRSYDGAPVDLNRPYEGNGVTVDNIWIRQDLRGTGTIKKVIKAALLKNEIRNAGAENLFIHWRRGPGLDIFRGYNYPNFFRKHTR